MCLFWREGVKLDASRSLVIHLNLDAGCQAKKPDTCNATLRRASRPPSEGHCLVSCVLGLFSLCHTCYSSEACYWYILSQFCGNFHYAKKVFK